MACFRQLSAKISADQRSTKHMECRVYLSAFNHADTEVVLRAVNQAPWRDKGIVQVFVKEQEQGEFLLRFSGRTQRPSATVELRKDELGIVNNALNEVCNGIQLDGEFDTRMGCTVEEAGELLAKIHALGSGH
jgi:hypothetical protein